jgi:HTH-type transcriptional regulator / antitoxin HigA
MHKIKPIRTETDYEAALARIDALMSADAGTAEGDELDLLTDLVEHYEDKHSPMELPSPIAAIEFRMEQADLTARDLVPFIGSRAKVSEVLSGKRQLTMPMARALHEHLGIPADVLLGERGTDALEPLASLEWGRFPLRAMAALGWIKKSRSLTPRPKDILQPLIQRAGGPDVAGAVLFRKSDHTRANAKTDPYALKAWCWQVLGIANKNLPSAEYQVGTVTLDFLRRIARLSWSDEGPTLAREFLTKHGIAMVVVRHLPKTYLDGAVFKVGNGPPVIGLTLRYDRIDNFWFCLLHELAHLGRHIDGDGDTAFVDDLTLRDVKGHRDDRKETEADEWAEEALVPRSTWETSAVRRNPSPSAVLGLAQSLQIHPAIIAGKIRHERRNYRMLSHFVGTGEVRRQLEQKGDNDMATNPPPRRRASPGRRL